MASSAEILPFCFKNGNLFCENVQIDKMFEESEGTSWKANLGKIELLYDVPPTPAYVYSAAGLRKNVSTYLHGLQVANLHGKIGYAIKANPNLQLVEKLKSFGVELIIAVSGYEVLSGIRAGFLPENILLNGNGKQRWEIKLAIENGVLLNVDSVFDASQIAQVHFDIKSEREVKVLLRIRPSKADSEDAQLKIHEYVNTAENSKFGFDMSELDEVLETIASNEKITVVGVHCHIGSGINNPNSFEWLGATLSAIIDELKKKGVVVRILNVGGGIGINYYDVPSGFAEYLSGVNKGNGPNYEELSTFQGEHNMEGFMSALARKIPPGMEVIVEPGRTLVGKAGILVCKSLGVKVSSNRSVLVVDGSMNEVIRPCLYGAHHQILPTKISCTEKWEEYDVVGPICESADFLGRKVLLQRSASYVAVMDCGAYCSSMASTYNLKPHAPEILVDDNTWEHIRKKESFHEITDAFYPKL